MKITINNPDGTTNEVHHETKLFEEMDSLLTWYASHYPCKRPEADEVLFKAVAKVLTHDSKIKVMVSHT